MAIKLLNFIQQIKKSGNINITTNNKPICFIGKDNPFMFLSHLFLQLKKDNILPGPYKNLIFESTDKSELHSSLTQTFLGQTYFYWLGNCTIKANDKKGINFLTLLSSYKGPHFVGLYLDKVKADKIIKKNNFQIIEIEEEFDENYIKIIIDFFQIKLTAKKQVFLDNFIYQNGKDLSLDSILMLLNYIDLIKLDKNGKTINYLSIVLGQETVSLNLLSKHFFENNPKELFKTWAKVQEKFSDVFWIAFWSEKIYRAYFVVHFLKNKNFSMAKSMSFGLPYSFFNKEWKKNSLKRLSNYYNFLYTNDFKVKTGSSFYFIDLFYLKHFSKKTVNNI